MSTPDPAPPGPLEMPLVQYWSLGTAPGAVDYRILLDFPTSQTSWQLWAEWLSSGAANEAFTAWAGQQPPPEPGPAQ
jgi:hypothetical protein